MEFLRRIRTLMQVGLMSLGLLLAPLLVGVAVARGTAAVLMTVALLYALEAAWILGVARFLRLKRQKRFPDHPTPSRWDLLAVLVRATGAFLFSPLLWWCAVAPSELARTAKLGLSALGVVLVGVFVWEARRYIQTPPAYAGYGALVPSKAQP